MTLSCYGSGVRQIGATPTGVKAGPLVLATPRRHGRVIDAPAVVQPGAAVTVEVSGRARLLYGSDRARVVRFEGCSDTTATGGPARFEGGIVAPGCATVRVWVAGRSEPLRRRACG